MYERRAQTYFAAEASIIGRSSLLRREFYLVEYTKREAAAFHQFQYRRHHHH